MSQHWKYTTLKPNDDNTFDVVTKPLLNPVDQLAAKAMGCGGESFKNLTRADATSQGAKFEAWRTANESGRTKSRRKLVQS